MVGVGSLPLAPKLLKGFSLYFWDGRMKVCATHRGPNPPPLLSPPPVFVLPLPLSGGLIGPH